MEKHSSSMQLTRRADYAVGALIYLAELYEGARVVLPELARVTEAPEDFLYQNFSRLCDRQVWSHHGAERMAVSKSSRGAEKRQSGAVGNLEVGGVERFDAYSILKSIKKACTVDRQLGPFAETSQPPDTGVVAPPSMRNCKG